MGTAMVSSVDHGLPKKRKQRNKKYFPQQFITNTVDYPPLFSKHVCSGILLEVPKASSGTVLIYPFYSSYIDRLPLLRSVQTVYIVTVRSLSNYDGDGNENVKEKYSI